MRRDFFAGSSEVATLQTVASKNASYDGAAVDVRRYSGNLAALLCSAAGTGTALVTNGVFSADTNWTKGTGWTIAAGVATCSGTQTAASLLSQDITAVEGTAYTVTFTISAYTAGTITPVVGGTPGTPRAGTGTYTEVIVAGDSGTLLAFSADADFEGSIDNAAAVNVSLKVEVQASADGSSGWATIATFPFVYGIAADQKLPVDSDKVHPYLRVKATLAGTSPVFIHGASLLGLR